MKARPLMKVFCPRNHCVGTVSADAIGLLINYTAEVFHTTGVFGGDAVDRLVDDDMTVLGGYCNACKKPVGLDARRLSSRAMAGDRDFRAAFSDTSDRSWTKAGHPPMYPPGMTRHRGDPR